MISIKYRINKAIKNNDNIARELTNCYSGDLPNNLEEKANDYLKELNVYTESFGKTLNSYLKKLNIVENEIEDRTRTAIKLLTNGEQEDFNELLYHQGSKTRTIKLLSQAIKGYDNLNVTTNHVMKVLEERFNVTFTYNKKDINKGKIYINPATFRKEFNKEPLKQDLMLDKIIAGLCELTKKELNNITGIIYMDNENNLHGFYIDNNYIERSKTINGQAINIKSLINKIDFNDKSNLSDFIKIITKDTGVNYEPRELLNKMNLIGLSINKDYFNELFNQGITEEPVNYESMLPIYRELKAEDSLNILKDMGPEMLINSAAGLTMNLLPDEFQTIDVNKIIKLIRAYIKIPAEGRESLIDFLTSKLKN